MKKSGRKELEIFYNKSVHTVPPSAGNGYPNLRKSRYDADQKRHTVCMPHDHLFIPLCLFCQNPAQLLIKGYAIIQKCVVPFQLQFCVILLFFYLTQRLPGTAV